MSASNGYDPSAPADVYFCSRKTQHAYRQVLWRMSVADAQAVCESSDTCHPGAWMMCWTVHELVDAKPICFAPDDGRFADLFERLGVTILMSRHMLLHGTAVMPLPPIKPVAPTTIPAVAQLGLFGEEEDAA